MESKKKSAKPSAPNEAAKSRRDDYGKFEEHSKRIVENFSSIFAITDNESFRNDAFKLLEADDHDKAKENLTELLKASFKAKEEALSRKKK